MRTYQVNITGKTALLMHWDNIDWADEMKAWQTDPSNRGKSAAGDDRTPAWRWVGCVYNDEKYVTMPSDNLMRCLMEGGAMIPVPGGKNGKTFKSLTQSGMAVSDEHWRLIADGKPIAWSDITALMQEEEFKQHVTRARELGFRLFTKRAKVGTSKHIRVRPRFDNWSLSGHLNVWDDKITETILRDVLTYAGNYKGLGDWRPSAPKSPGCFGMFDAVIKKV